MSQATGFDFRAAIEKAMVAIEEAGNSGDAATFASFYMDDATLLPPGSPPVKGRANIQGYWQALFAAGASDATLRSVDVGASGDLAYEIGSFEANMPNPEGGTSRTQGKYLAVWKRQADGSVKMAADMFSANA